jgi:hypothetical protein
MSATITNKSKQPVVLILDHPEFARKRTTASFGQTNEAGVRSVTEVRRSHPSTLTIFPGQSVEGVHSAVVNCAQVANLLASKGLHVTHDDQEKA